MADAYAARLDPLTKRETYQAVVAELRNVRTKGTEARWRQLADYIAPDRVQWQTTDRNQGGRLDAKIVNNTASLALRTLESGMHSGLTSPARPWMKLTTPDPDLAKFPTVKRWLSDVTQRMLDVFEKSNLYTELPVVYGDIGCFSTSAMAVLDSRDDKIFRCHAYPLGSYWLGMDEQRRVQTFYREFSMTVRQIIRSFGGPDGQPLARGQRMQPADRARFSNAVLNAWDRSNYEQVVDICWLVMPNEEADDRKLGAAYLPFTSCHFEKSSDGTQYLRESGFNEFPVMAPRWKVRGEDTYGYMCPGLAAIGDTIQLQAMERRKGQAIEKQINPPVQAPVELRTQKTSLLPGDITYLARVDDKSGVRAIHEVTIDLRGINESQGETMQRINRAFFADLFLMLSQDEQAQPITAREVAERHEEKLIALGPVVERTDDELLNPLVDRVFPLMLRAGLIPPPPDELHGVDLKVEYTSIIAQAQRLVGVSALDRFVGTVNTVMAPVDPTVLDKVNNDAIIDEYADRLGLPVDVVRSEAEVQQIRQNRAQAQQQQAQADNAAKLAQATQRLGTTPQDNNSVLASLVGAPT